MCSKLIRTQQTTYQTEDSRCHLLRFSTITTNAKYISQLLNFKYCINDCFIMCYQRRSNQEITYKIDSTWFNIKIKFKQYSTNQPGRTRSLWQVQRVSDCNCTRHTWLSSWCWSQYRCRHVHSRVSNLAVKTMMSSCWPSPAHTTPGRPLHSSTSCMTSLVPRVALTSRERSVAATSAAETTIPSSSSSSLFVYVSTINKQ